jgi:DNA-binding NtrC family response regulator
MNAAVDRYLAESLVGVSEAMRRVRALIAKIAQSDIAVLLQGPTGSGKELVAHALHEMSGRAGPIVAFNVCAIADSMFEDALFGHVRGAFTGAIADSRGYLAEADHGSLFLDEVSGLPVMSQAKLLRAIETGEFRPVGAATNRRSHFRTIAATNEEIATLIDAGRFRPDLAQRLCGIVIHLPALAERPGDVRLLAEHFLARLTMGSEPAQLTAGALAALERHDWPGNVRELQQVVTRAIALSGRRQLNRDDVAEAIAAGPNLHTAPPPFVSVSDEEHSIARRRLVQVLASHGWDKTGAAAELGVHPVTLYRRMRRLRIPMRPERNAMSGGAAAECVDVPAGCAQLRHAVNDPDLQTLS